MNYEETLLSHRIIPRPVSFKLDSQELFRLENGAHIVLEGDASILKKAKSVFLKNARLFWKIRPSVSISENKKKIVSEGYEIVIEKESVIISAGCEKGFLNASKTLRQLAETERGVFKYSCHILPCATIHDAPVLGFRGIHFCWFPETSASDIEKQIRLAAYYKFNYAIIESWGVFEFASHPEICWSEFSVKKTEFKRLVKLGKELGITLIPQVNIFGHASFSRCGTGKHTLLNFHPEFESLFEPDGWTWCISNPATRKFLTDMVLEIYETFDQPEFFHIGCDEAYNAGSCTMCRRNNYKKLFIDHITYFHDLFAKRGTRVMMWHDMLLDRDDPRWYGYIVSGRKINGLTNLHKDLPKDIIICDWQYDYNEIDGKEPEWATSRFFKKHGFDVLVCPWINTKGTDSLGKLAKNNNLYGILETTWHQNQAQNTFRIFFHAACASWSNEAKIEHYITYREFMNQHLREVCQDMGLQKYSQIGNVAYQINPHNFQE